MTTKSERKIYLVRHGRSEWNGRKIISGQLNPPLSEEGRRQAESLAECLDDENLTAIYTSSLSRTIETARPTAKSKGLEIQECDALREINFGVLQGRFRDERDTEARDLWAKREKTKADFRFPGGETFAELETRVDACLEKILQTVGTVLIVGHRSTNRAILSRLMNWTRETVINLRLRSKFLYEITLADFSKINTIQICGGAKYYGFLE